MPSQNYECSVKATATAEECFEKIGRVSEWWTKNFNGSARKPGDAFTVHFGETFVDFKIAEAIPGKTILWQVTNSNLPWLKNKTEWNGTSVVWELSSENGTTTVAMTHRGLVPGIECYNNCQEGWNFYVADSLRQFLTEGKGLPDGKGRSKGEI